VAPRKKFRHPLDTHGAAEIDMWIYDETIGSLSQMARINLGVQADTWARAAWRAAIAMEHTVLGMQIKHRRRLYTLMRNVTDPSTLPRGGDQDDAPLLDGIASEVADHLVPELGMTLGHLSVFHILDARTQYTKERGLSEWITGSDMMQPEMCSRFIRIDAST